LIIAEPTGLCSAFESHRHLRRSIRCREAGWFKKKKENNVFFLYLFSPIWSLKAMRDVDTVVGGREGCRSGH